MCRGVERGPIYVEGVVRRWQRFTGMKAAVRRSQVGEPMTGLHRFVRLKRSRVLTHLVSRIQTLANKEIAKEPHSKIPQSARHTDRCESLRNGEVDIE